jgi:hypothetical protein
LYKAVANHAPSQHHVTPYRGLDAKKKKLAFFFGGGKPTVRVAPRAVDHSNLSLDPIDHHPHALVYVKGAECPALWGQVIQHRKKRDFDIGVIR